MAGKSKTAGEAARAREVPILRTLGTNVRKLRELHGLTQKDLAVRMGRSQVWVAHVELGDRDTPVSRLVELARVLKTNVAALVA